VRTGASEFVADALSVWTPLAEVWVVRRRRIIVRRVPLLLRNHLNSDGLPGEP
jgi:hypothetical protein